MSQRPDASFDVHTLQFYKQREAKRTLTARVVLLGLICGMLVANVAISWRAHSDMLTNVDQARLAQVTLAEQTDGRIMMLQTEIEALRIELALERQRAQNAETVAAR